MTSASTLVPEDWLKPHRVLKLESSSARHGKLSVHQIKPDVSPPPPR